MNSSLQNFPIKFSPHPTDSVFSQQEHPKHNDLTFLNLWVSYTQPLHTDATGKILDQP